MVKEHDKAKTMEKAQQGTRNTTNEVGKGEDGEIRHVKSTETSKTREKKTKKGAEMNSEWEWRRDKARGNVRAST